MYFLTRTGKICVCGCRARREGKGQNSQGVGQAAQRAVPLESAPSFRPRWLWFRRPRLHRPSARRSVSRKRSRGRSGAPGTAAGPAPSAPSCRPRWLWLRRLWLRRPRLHRPSARRSVSVKRTRGRSGAPGTAAGPAPSAPSQRRRRHRDRHLPFRRHIAPT